MKNVQIQSGEEVTYELSFNWKFIWMTAGKASLSFKKATFDSKPAYRIDLIAVGNKKADNIYKIRDTLTSYISERLEPMYFRKGAIEGKRYWVDQAYFSYKDGQSHVRQTRDRDGKQTEYLNSDSRCIHDLLSVIAWARTMDFGNLKVGDKLQIPVATGRRVDEQKLVFEGREIYKPENGIKYNCLVFTLWGKDKKGKEKETITFYITDDRNRIPIMLDLFLNFGAARANMVKVTGEKYPFDSIVTN